MDKTNPYTSPEADIINQVKNDPSAFFSLKGRLGRIDYLVYCCSSILSVALFAILFIELMQMLSTSWGGIGGSSFFVVVFALLLIILPMVICYFTFTKRRLNDLNRSGWFSLAIFVPFVNVLCVLFFLFAAGDKCENDYGEPPQPPSLMMKIAAVLLGLLVTWLYVYPLLSVLIRWL